MYNLANKVYCTYREVCVKSFMELRRNHHKIVLLVEMLSIGETQSMHEYIIHGL
jgi:hypothetical protein